MNGTFLILGLMLGFSVGALYADGKWMDKCQTGKPLPRDGTTYQCKPMITKEVK